MTKVIWVGYKRGWEIERKNGKLVFTYKRFHQGAWVKGKTITLPTELAKRVEVI